MEEKEMLEQANETENVETLTTEENVDGLELTDTAETTESTNVEEENTVKTFTQEEVDEIVRKRLARKEKDYKKELEKYKNVESVLNAGLGTTNIDEASSKLRTFYKEQGIELPAENNQIFDEEELQVLGENDAQKLLDLGLDEAEEEANRLAIKGRQNWNAREEAEFSKLASVLTYEKQKKELKTIGVDSKILDSSEFKEFSKKFNSNTSIKDIYSLYTKTNKANEQKNITKLGSMKNDTAETIKDFYSYEESLKFTREDFDKNPKLFEAVTKSMSKW